MKSSPIHKTSFFIFGLTLVIGFIWLLKGPSDQELLANMAKAEDFHPWLGWWSNNFLLGGSVAPQLTTLFTILPLKLFGFFLGFFFGGKVAGLVALCAAGFAMNLFICDWTGDARAGLLGACAYMLGPQMSLQLGFNEHLPVVFSMVYGPLVLWSLWVLMKECHWKSSLFLALSYGAMLLTFSKMAVCFLPIAIGFLIIITYQLRGEFREGSAIVAVLLRLTLSLFLLIPLAIVPLLPALREYSWLTLFTYEPFGGWLNNFSLQSTLAFLDRDSSLSNGMALNFNLDHGGFYLGIVTIFLIWLMFASHQEENKKLKKIVHASLLLLLLSAWLSIGPSSLIGRTLLFLQSAKPLQNVIIPLFWITFVGSLILVWQLCPSFFNKNKDHLFRSAIVLLFLFVPGFALFELLPFAKGIRAPWSLWQMGGSLFLALLFGCAASFCTASWNEKKLQKWGSVALIFLLIVDFYPYLSFYHRGALKAETFNDFSQTVHFLKQNPSHSRVIPFSGRYFYLQIPALTGHPLTDEAFNRYFQLKWVRSLGNSLNPSEFKEFLNLLGASYLFIDKEDPTTSKQSQDFYRSLFPVAFENNSFLILENQSSLYPAFIARDFVVFPQESYSAAGVSLHLASMNLLSLEMKQANPGDLGFAGMVKGNNQVELLPHYKEHGGLPFTRINSDDSILDHDQKIVFHLSPSVSGWCVITTAFHPDWKGTVDGQSSNVYLAAGALLSMYVPLNSQEIIFKFTPPCWYTLCFDLGIFCWILALLALFLKEKHWALVRWKR
ncbi:MAG: hypothetical protein QE493_03720 [Verrucomicrobiae bacterium]|nr:hypothetical protein [Verrucomicrobiae bacterium]